MNEKLDKIEWAVDCLKSRVDAEERTRLTGGVGYFGTWSDVHENSLSGDTEKKMKRESTWNVPIRCPQT